MDSRASEFFNRYERRKQVGEGTYGVVYEARDTQTGRTVALKKIRLDQGGDDGVPGTAIREVSLLKELQHPNVLRLEQTVYMDKKLYLVLEFLPLDLRRFLDRDYKTGAPLEIAKKLTFQMIRGVEFCHARRILHRDLKPQNLLIDAVGNLKLGDFGLARAFGIPVRQFTHEVVTLWYRAPEVLLGAQQYSTPVDVWSCGTIMAEIISGKPLFPGDSEIDELFRIFSVLGTPDEGIWSGVTNLQDWHTTFPRFRGKALTDVVPNLDPVGASLMQGLLTLDPARRLSARQALEHPWFDSVREECMAQM